MPVRLAIVLATASAAGAADQIYWTNDAGTSPISFANLNDSGGGGQLPATGATTAHPDGVAIDLATNTIYWANAGDNVHPISFARLHGSGGGFLNVTGATAATADGVAIDPAANKIVWRTSPDGDRAMGSNTSSPCVVNDQMYFGTTAGASGQPSVPLWILAQMFGVGSLRHDVRDSLSVTSDASAGSHVSVETYCV